MIVLYSSPYLRLFAYGHRSICFTFSRMKLFKTQGLFADSVVFYLIAGAILALILGISVS
jgi:hypothetical protein